MPPEAKLHNAGESIIIIGERTIMKTKKLPIGVSDFKDIVSGGYCYVDKTLFIKEIMDKGDKILLVPRPRRFGKTLNLSMLEYFYQCSPCPADSAAPPAKNGDNPLRKTFESLNIGKSGAEYMDEQGQYPVIFLSFRDIKESNWETTYSKIKMLIQVEYSRHYYLINNQTLLPFEKEYFQKIVGLKGDLADYEISLGKLLVFLNRFYGKRVVILIDEYDSPVHAGFDHGFYDNIINFMRNFLSGGLKDTDRYLEKSVITGIMRIAKESVFSGLNNPGVYTLLSEEFDEHFGFTEQEVENLLKEFRLLDMYDEVKKWYNGYRFGERVVYNPWSIINFLGSKAKKLKPYWLNTSDNKIINTLLSKGGKELKKELEQLISGDIIEKEIDENIVLKEVPLREDLLWSFLLMGGYLKHTGTKKSPYSNKTLYLLSIPNLEVRVIYEKIINHYFTLKTGEENLEAMIKALVEGDVELFEILLRKVVTAVFSFHDFGGESEKVYHALAAGLLLWISGTHEIKSNRESGYGRYDIMIIPRDPAGVGYVIEFKKVDPDRKETVASATKAALQQIEDKKYYTELQERGIADIRQLAVLFSGKEVYVKESGK